MEGEGDERLSKLGRCRALKVFVMQSSHQACC